MQEVQKHSNTNCNIALCEIDKFELFVRMGRGVANITERLSRGRDEINGTAE
jgi:hypothetical protein